MTGIKMPFDKNQPHSAMEEASFDRELIENVHPKTWINPEPVERYHLVIIGAGTAGLVTAAGAAGLGAKVALIERQFMGGDCLNFGCVPSKALIRASRAVADVGRAQHFGIKVSPDAIRIDFREIMERVRRIRAELSSNDSAKRFQSLGIDLFFGQASFVDDERIQVEGRHLRFSKAVIATGARPAIPNIQGLSEVGYLTNETVFSLTELPRRLAVLGGGPVGCELAQAFCRLGSQVTLFQKHDQLLSRDDRDAAELIQNVFKSEGISVILESKVLRVAQTSNGKRIDYEVSGVSQSVIVDQILVAAGRTPNVEGLELDRAGVNCSVRGITVNDYLQTTHSRIYAAGDVCLKWKFTHAADAAARIVVQNALFPVHKKVSALTIPRCTYTDPEIAQVGLSEAEACARGIAHDTFTRKLNQVDRALLDGDESGFVKILATKSGGKILGATIVARHAGEMINEITLAIDQNIGMGTLANIIHPYPTQAEAIKHCTDAFNRRRLTPGIAKLIRAWLNWFCY